MSSKSLLCLILCLCSLYHNFVQAGKIHDSFTEAEIKRIFHRDSSEVPEYKHAAVKTLHSQRSKRETRPVEFEVDGEKIRLNLKPIKHNVFSYNVPVWTAETVQNEPSGHLYRQLDSKQTQIDGVFYEDPATIATLLAYYKDQYIYYDGIFGESKMTKIVRSEPEKWWRAPGTEAGDDHIIFDANKDNSTTTALPGDHPTGSDKLAEPLKVMYPKLLLIVEYEYFKLLAEDVTETVKYLATFWNAVNLQYAKLTSPKVKIVIGGIIIAKDDTALRFIYDSRNQTDLSILNPYGLLSRGADYFNLKFNKEVDFKNYDSTITMTNLDTGVIAGAAYIGQICSSTSNIGFVKDDASFSGLQAATHELGHLLNLPHDGTGKAKECNSYPDENVSTIMAPFAAWVEKYEWSECSKKILQNFAWTKAAECMKHNYRS